jgi:hypothetical protein
LSERRETKNNCQQWRSKRPKFFVLHNK